VLRTTFIVLFAALAAGCTTPAGGGKKVPPAITPTQNFKLEAEQTTDQIALAQHAEGLSGNQLAALADYAKRYHETGGEVVSIKAPATGGEAAMRTAYGAKAALEASGLSAADLKLGAYPADKPDAPVLIVYERWRAKPIACGKSWDNLTATRDNRVQSNFGCAVTANMAAQIADPRDIRGAHATDPSDAGRRTTVIDNYRKGDITAAKSDDKAKANVSQAVQ
jgi:pilus assembly protein CpaD